MSKLAKGIAAASVIIALGAAALASDSSDIIMKPGQGYIIGSDGRVAVGALSLDSAQIARAEEVKHGTTLFMRNGRVVSVHQ